MQISVLRKLQICMIAWIGIYSYLIGDDYDQYFILALFFLSTFACRKNWHTIRFRIDTYLAVWGNFFLVAGITIFFSFDILSAFKGWLLDILSVLTAFMCRQGDNNWEKYLLYGLYVFSGGIVLSIYVQFLNPSLIDSINALILNFEQLSINRALLMNNAYAGITGQTGTAGYACSIFIAASFVVWLFRQKSSTFFWFCNVVAGFGALILTGKRGLLGACLVAMVLVLYLYCRYYKKSITEFLLLVFFGVAVFSFSFVYVDAFQTMGDKIASMSLSGREERFSLMWSGFLEQPILGNGLGGVAKYEITAHNEYLRVLFETGIIGTIAYMFALAYNFKPCVGGFKTSFAKKIFTDTELVILFSFFVQVVHFIYAMSGNPLSANEQFLLFSIISSIGLHNVLIKKYVGTSEVH